MESDGDSDGSGNWSSRGSNPKDGGVATAVSKMFDFCQILFTIKVTIK